jgi:hypothetical protein
VILGPLHKVFFHRMFKLLPGWLRTPWVSPKSQRQEVKTVHLFRLSIGQRSHRAHLDYFPMGKCQRVFGHLKFIRVSLDTLIKNT